MPAPISLELWPNTAQGCNHQSTCMPQLQPLCSAALVPNVLPQRNEGSGKPVQWLKPYGILAPRTRTRATGFEIISGDHYTTTTTEEFPDSSVSSLMCNWLTPGRPSSHRKLIPISMNRQLPNGDWLHWSSIGRVNFCKVSPKAGCSAWGKLNL